MASSPRRRPPFLPTTLEAAALVLYPALLAFGTVYSLISPVVRNAAYDADLQAHSQDPALSPSYFARKSNIFNVMFVKRGWVWVSVAFFVFLLTHPGVRSGQQRARGLVRWGLVTAWWMLVTQWCFGPALIDRSFRFTGGICELAEARLEAGGVGLGGQNLLTAGACKAAGGQWTGGHDISGHVFLLVLGSYFLLQEVGWVLLNDRQRVAGRSGATLVVRDDRSVVMDDGAIKPAAIERGNRYDSEEETCRVTGAWEALGLGGKLAGGVVLLSWWMILMTAIYFHTWVEKLTGLLAALTGLHAVYLLPRLVPALRGIVGLPGI